jgi:2-polyprenyl-6-methoxyphenol hydroxylase-like FAD-dependent oxidoreductase
MVINKAIEEAEEPGVGRRGRCWERAVVIGGGYAGLVSARILTDYFRSVIVVEQDRLGESVGVHPHVPQGYHAHAVLAKGAQVLESLFPGLRAELAAVGAPVFDFGERISFLTPYGFAPRDRAGMEIQSFTRDELELCLRRRVLALPGVSLRDGTRCLGLTVAAPGRGRGKAARVTGVSIRSDDSPSDAAPVDLEADLVVDATGRSSSLAHWLEPLGVRVPGKRVVKAKITYTSLSFARPSGDEVDFHAAYQMTFAPDVPRGGVMLRVERDRWMCSLIGYGEHIPPTDDEGYLEFARTLANPRLAQLLEQREAQDDPHRYTNMNNEWNQYHRAERWPQRLVVLGDAVCVFNPVYAQGLTVSALEADLLREMLDQRLAKGRGLDGLSSAYQRKVARIILPPWILATNSDLMWFPGGQPFMARAAYWYNRHLLAVAVNDAAVWGSFIKAFNMILPPTSLFRPSVAAKIIGHGLLSRSKDEAHHAER